MDEIPYNIFRWEYRQYYNFSLVSILVTHFRPWRQSRARHHHPGLGDNRHLNHHRNRLHRVVQEQQCRARHRDNDYRGQAGPDHFRVTPGPEERPRHTQNNLQTAPAGQGCVHWSRTDSPCQESPSEKGQEPKKRCLVIPYGDKRAKLYRDFVV